MKITKRELRKIIKEEKLKLLNEEPSDYYRDYKNGSISYEDYQQLVKDYERKTGGSGTRNSNYRPPSRKTFYVGSDANADQIAAVEAALSAKPNNFLTSVLKQLENGRGLSDKQNSIVASILKKQDPLSARLFEAKLVPTDAIISQHINQFSVSDDPYDVAEEIGEEYGWSQKQIEMAERIIRKKYIR